MISTVMAFFEKYLPTTPKWTSDLPLAETDQALASLANSESPFAKRASVLIGKTHRLAAFILLKTIPQRIAAYESADSLPATVPFGERLLLMSRLTLQQVTREPGKVIPQQLLTVLGSITAFGWLTYDLYRSSDFLSNRRLFNTLGNGFLFGLIYGLAIWNSRHIVTTARSVPRWLRLSLAIAIGTIIFLIGASLFQVLVYDDVLDPAVGLLSGALFVGGFALSINMPFWVQAIAGITGVMGALLIPWSYYLNDGTRAPFIFDADNPDRAVFSALVAAALICICTLGNQWRQSFQNRKSIKAPAVVKIEATTSNQIIVGK
jgi:hypothetical protein